MKKRTDEEKREMIDKACDLFNEANEKIIEGKRLMNLCGIKLCNSYHAEEAREELNEHNLHIYSGIRLLEKLTKQDAYHRKHLFTKKPDKSVLLIRYKGLLFVQLGEEKTATDRKFTFR